jgi:hypothetical protein
MSDKMKKITLSLITCFGFSFCGFAQKTAISTPDTAFLRKQLLQPDTVNTSNEIIILNSSSTKTATSTQYKILYAGDSASYKSKSKQSTGQNYTPVKSADE